MSYIIASNLKLPGQLVLIDDNGEVVGIIRTIEKYNDISTKVLNALYNHESCERVEFTENTVLDTTERYYFDAYITDFDGDAKLKSYTIELTATY